MGEREYEKERERETEREWERESNNNRVKEGERGSDVAKF